MKICINGTIREMTEEEVKEREALEEQERAELMSLPYEQRVSRLIRERYSVDDELALSRQREAKAEEFQDYYDFCEECKRRAKEADNIDNI